MRFVWCGFWNFKFEWGLSNLKVLVVVWMQNTKCSMWSQCSRFNCRFDHLNSQDFDVIIFTNLVFMRIYLSFTSVHAQTSSWHTIFSKQIPIFYPARPQQSRFYLTFSRFQNWNGIQKSHSEIEKSQTFKELIKL